MLFHHGSLTAARAPPDRQVAGWKISSVRAAEPGLQLDANSPAPASIGAGQRFLAARKAQIRAGHQLDAAKAGVLKRGELFTATEIQRGDDGLARIRFDRGWVSESNAAGEQILMDLSGHMYCKKCNAAFSDDGTADPRCTAGHQNFMYTRKIPDGIDTSNLVASRNRDETTTTDEQVSSYKLVSSYISLRKTQVRQGFELDSSKICVLSKGDVVEVLEIRLHDRVGVTRLRYRHGWISESTATGDPIMIRETTNQRLEDHEAGVPALGKDESQATNEASERRTEALQGHHVDSVICRFQVLLKTQVREACAMDSGKVSLLTPGELVEAFEFKADDETGLTRIRFAGGWASPTMATGVVILQMVEDLRVPVVAVDGPGASEQAAEIDTASAVANGSGGQATEEVVTAMTASQSTLRYRLGELTGGSFIEDTAWQLYFTDDTNFPYFYNCDTNETTWDEPVEVTAALSSKALALMSADEGKLWFLTTEGKYSQVTPAQRQKIISAFTSQGIELPLQVDPEGEALPRSLEEKRQRTRAKSQPPPRSSVPPLSEHKAAARVQSMQRGRAARRGMPARREQQQQQQAATKLQSMRRGRTARLDVQGRREQRAATRVQSMQRGRVARRSANVNGSARATAFSAVDKAHRSALARLARDRQDGEAQLASAHQIGSPRQLRADEVDSPFGKLWVDLTPEQRNAAQQLSFEQSTWDAERELRRGGNPAALAAEAGADSKAQLGADDSVVDVYMRMIDADGYLAPAQPFRNERSHQHRCGCVVVSQRASFSDIRREIEWLNLPVPRPYRFLKHALGRDHDLLALSKEPCCVIADLEVPGVVCLVADAYNEAAMKLQAAQRGRHVRKKLDGARAIRAKPGENSAGEPPSMKTKHSRLYNRLEFATHVPATTMEKFDKFMSKNSAPGPVPKIFYWVYLFDKKIVKGSVYNYPGQANGAPIVTSKVAFALGKTFATRSGSRYELGEPEHEFKQQLEWAGLYRPDNPLQPLLAMEHTSQVLDDMAQAQQNTMAPAPDHPPAGGAARAFGSADFARSYAEFIRGRRAQSEVVRIQAVQVQRDVERRKFANQEHARLELRRAVKLRQLQIRNRHRAARTVQTAFRVHHARGMHRQGRRANQCLASVIHAFIVRRRYQPSARLSFDPPPPPPLLYLYQVFQ